MKNKLTLIFLLIGNLGFGQSIIEWSPDYKLKLEDFQSSQTEINEELTSSFIVSGASMRFAYGMSAGQFAFTKNFNSKVTTHFDKNASAIMAPDSLTAQALLNYAQYEFDFTELYSRKFRKEMFEQKGVFSDFNFSQAIFDSLQSEMSAEVAKVLKATEFGTKADLLRIEHEKVLAQVIELSDFCKECTPPKKKKDKKI